MNSPVPARLSPGSSSTSDHHQLGEPRRRQREPGPPRTPRPGRASANARAHEAANAAASSDGRPIRAPPLGPPRAPRRSPRTPPWRAGRACCVRTRRGPAGRGSRAAGRALVAEPNCADRTRSSSGTARSAPIVPRTNHPVRHGPPGERRTRPRADQHHSRAATSQPPCPRWARPRRQGIERRPGSAIGRGRTAPPRVGPPAGGRRFAAWSCGRAARATAAAPPTMPICVTRAVPTETRTAALSPSAQASAQQNGGSSRGSPTGRPAAVHLRVLPAGPARDDLAQRQHHAVDVLLGAAQAEADADRLLPGAAGDADQALGRDVGAEGAVADADAVLRRKNRGEPARVEAVDDEADRADAVDRRVEQPQLGAARDALESLAQPGEQGLLVRLRRRPSSRRGFRTRRRARTRRRCWANRLRGARARCSRRRRPR